MRKIYARALYEDASATLDDLLEAAATLAKTERTARRVLGGEHPFTVEAEDNLREARAALRVRADVESIRKAVEAMTAGDA